MERRSLCSNGGLADPQRDKSFASRMKGAEAPGDVWRFVLSPVPKCEGPGAPIIHEGL